MDGVVRPPSAFSMTRGLPPSMTATQEFVVPRSIPMILPIVCLLLRPACDRDYVVLCCDMGASRVLFKALDTTAARRRKCLSAARQLPAALLTMTMAGRSRRPFRV
jgi:hypothetical protein